ncbi:MAG: gamma carbonic anhydrase family protein [Phycisphaerae bacterium]|nr:gamma carbonic anhydrase family protein [Phycisphaerae bacterium]
MPDLPPRVVYGQNVFVASTAYIGGDVIIGDDCTIMHHVTIRGDVAPIRLGNRVNIQDGCVLHCNRDVMLELEDDVGVGHRAVIHCQRIGANSLIGTGAVLLDNAVVGRGCIVAAGALVTAGFRVPDGTVVMGVPARVVRPMEDRDRAYQAHVVQSYLTLGRLHAAGKYPNQPPE